MDAIDLEGLENDSKYKSPEPENFVASTKGPQFADLFFTPSQLLEEQSAPSTKEPNVETQLYNADGEANNKEQQDLSSSNLNQIEKSRNGGDEVMNIEPEGGGGEHYHKVHQINTTVNTDQPAKTALDIEKQATIGHSVSANTDQAAKTALNIETQAAIGHSVSSNKDDQQQERTLDDQSGKEASSEKGEAGEQYPSLVQSKEEDDEFNFESSEAIKVKAPEAEKVQIPQVKSVKSVKWSEATGVTVSETAVENELRKNQRKEADGEFDFELPQYKITKPKMKLKADVQEEVDNAKLYSPQVSTGQVDIEISSSDMKSTPATAGDSSVSHVNDVKSTPATVGDSSMSHVIDEWEAVQTIEAVISSEGTSSDGTVRSGPKTTPLINYPEAYKFFMETDLHQYRDQIESTVSRSGFRALKHALFGPPKLHPGLTTDRENVFCLAQCGFSNDEAVHLQILQTIYKKLTGAKLDCARFGSHWEQIGFQGSDPSTDLRSCGMLGLMNLLFALTTSKYFTTIKDIYKLSLHEVQNFPFCVMGINITRIALQALRHDCLNKEINRERLHSGFQAVFKIFNEFYVAVFYDFYTVWKTQHKTIANTGFVIKDLENASKKRPHILLQNLERHLQSTKQTEINTQEEPLNLTKFSE